MGPYSKPVYDPLPPYDPEELEAGPTPTEQENADIPLTDQSQSNVTIKDDTQRGQMSQRECCFFAFHIILVCVAGFVACVWIIAYFAYKGAKLGNDSHSD